MKQEAPDPEALFSLVAVLKYKPGWVFRLLDDYDRGQGSKGLTLVINITGLDSYHHDRAISVNHLFPVPPAAYDERSWRRWLFDRIGDVDTHERCEWFQLLVPAGPEHRAVYDNETEVLCTCAQGVDHRGDSPPQVRVERPYAPSHGPGSDPYLVRELGTELDQRTSFRGKVKEPDA